MTFAAQAQRCREGVFSAGILEQSMRARNRVGIALSYRPARLHRLAKFKNTVSAAAATRGMVYRMTRVTAWLVICHLSVEC